MDTAHIWIYLPGDVRPTLCGTFQHRADHGGRGVGRFTYDAAYLKNSDRIPVDPVVLPLKAGELVSTLQIGVFGALLDATPEAWGRKVIDLQSGATSTPLQYALRS